MSPPGRRRAPGGTGARNGHRWHDDDEKDRTTEVASFEGYVARLRYRQRQRERVEVVRACLLSARDCIDAGLSGAKRLDEAVGCAEQALGPAWRDILREYLDESA